MDTYNPLNERSGEWPLSDVQPSIYLIIYGNKTEKKKQRRDKQN